VNCLITNDVYPHDRQRLLIPAGSKVLGDAQKVDTFGRGGLAVAFHRLLMPNGYSVSLDQFKGLDQASATALKDKVNNHYLKIFGASLALGILEASFENIGNSVEVMHEERVLAHYEVRSEQVRLLLQEVTSGFDRSEHSAQAVEQPPSSRPSKICGLRFRSAALLTG
jgi:hypothetical protein